MVQGFGVTESEKACLRAVQDPGSDVPERRSSAPARTATGSLGDVGSAANAIASGSNALEMRREAPARS